MWFQKDKNGLSVKYGARFALPEAPGRGATHREMRPPFLLDLVRGKALYNASEDSRNGKANPALVEYSLRTRRWRTVAPPEGYAPEYGTDGFFYWSGRLLYSPQPERSQKGAAQGLYERGGNGKEWKRLSSLTVLALSPAKRTWLVRDLQGRCWVATAH